MEQNGLAIVFGIIIIICCGVVITTVYDMVNSEKTMVEGNIVDTKFFERGNDATGTKYYVNITLNDGEVYTIWLNEDYYDFTVNSKLVLYLYRGGLSDSWKITKMVKVPDGSK